MNQAREKSVTLIEGGKPRESFISSAIAIKLEKRIAELERQVAVLQLQAASSRPAIRPTTRRWTDAQNRQRMAEAIKQSMAGDRKALTRFYEQGGWAVDLS